MGLHSNAQQNNDDRFNNFEQWILYIDKEYLTPFFTKSRSVRDVGLLHSASASVSTKMLAERLELYGGFESEASESSAGSNLMASISIHSDFSDSD